MRAGLILAGGLALGAYQAGAVAALIEGGVEVTAIAGSSIGAIHAALLAGGTPETRVARLLGFWRDVAQEGLVNPLAWTPLRGAQSLMGVLSARLAGVPGLFRPRIGPTGRATPSLYDLAPLGQRLDRDVDWARLNAGSPRVCIAAIDIESAAPAWFDTQAGVTIGRDHVLASGGLLPNFPAMPIDGRLHGDGGLGANAPLEPFLSSERQGALPDLFFLIDLFPAAAPPPATLIRAAERSNDLTYAAQTGMRLAGLVRERALEARLGNEVATRVVAMAYHNTPIESGPEKTFDFSRATIDRRIAAGRADAAAALALAAARDGGTRPGLNVLTVPPRDPS